MIVQGLMYFSRFLAAFAIALLLTSCGQFFPGANTIVALQITPASSLVLISGTQQFTATATFGNNSTGDVSSSVNWNSSLTSIATISTSGLATAATSLPAGTTIGTTTISAKSGSVIATGVPLTVAKKHIGSITVSPTTPTISSGTQQQFTATATFSDGTNAGNVTNLVAWTSSDITIATITSTGLATGVSTGTATITASLDNQTGTTTLTVQ